MIMKRRRRMITITTTATMIMKRRRRMITITTTATMLKENEEEGKTRD